jgi:hypothetical protein
MGLHRPLGHLKHKLWSKERPRVKLVVWLPITKSQESTWFPCVQGACNIPLKSSQQRLKLCFRPHRHWRSSHEVMGPQSRGSPSCGNFRTPTWEFRDKMPLDVAPVKRHIEYYKGEGDGFPQVRAVVSLVSPNCSWLVLAPKVFQLYTNHLVLILSRFVWVSEACQFFLVPSRNFNMPLYPSKV